MQLPRDKLTRRKISEFVTLEETLQLPQQQDIYTHIERNWKHSSRMHSHSKSIARIAPHIALTALHPLARTIFHLLFLIRIHTAGRSSPAWLRNRTHRIHFQTCDLAYAQHVLRNLSLSNKSSTSSSIAIRAQLKSLQAITLDPKHGILFNMRTRAVCVLKLDWSC